MLLEMFFFLNFMNSLVTGRAMSIEQGGFSACEWKCGIFQISIPTRGCDDNINSHTYEN